MSSVVKGKRRQPGRASSSINKRAPSDPAPKGAVTSTAGRPGAPARPNNPGTLGDNVDGNSNAQLSGTANHRR